MISLDRERIKRALVERGRALGWLVKHLKRGLAKPEQHRSRLALLDRISLAPRQSLVLVDAEGSRILVATSPDGGSAFFALDGEADRSGHVQVRSSNQSNSSAKSRKNQPSSRVSW